VQKRPPLDKEGTLTCLRSTEHPVAHDLSPVSSRPMYALLRAPSSIDQLTIY